MSTNIVIDLDIDELDNEVNNIMNLKADYNQYLKENYVKWMKNKKINLYKNTISTKLGKMNSQSTKTITFENFPIVFSMKDNNNESTINLEIYNELNELLFKKQLIIPKITSFDIIENYDKEIDNNNLINKMKNLMDKINNLNTIEQNDKYIQLNGNLIDKNTLDNKLKKYRIEYEDLRKIYNNLVETRTKIIDIKREILSDNNMKLDNINQQYNNFKNTDISLYNKTNGKNTDMMIDKEKQTKVSDRIAGISLKEELDFFLRNFDHKNLDFLKSKIYKINIRQF